MLVDSNIIIYATRPEDKVLRRFFEQQLPAVSNISRVEVLGYHKLTEATRKQLEAFFDLLRVLPITHEIVEKAIHLPQQRKLSLGDALIAGITLENHLTSVTRNTDDLQWIDGLALLDPFHDRRPQAEGNEWQVFKKNFAWVLWHYWC